MRRPVVAGGILLLTIAGGLVWLMGSDERQGKSGNVQVVPSTFLDGSPAASRDLRLPTSLAAVRDAAERIGRPGYVGAETVHLPELSFPGNSRHLTPEERKFVGRLGDLISRYPGVQVGFAVGSDQNLVSARASTLFLEMSQQHVDERRIRLDGTSRDGGVAVTIRPAR